MTDEEVAGFLEDGGFPPHIVAGGSQGLLRRWEEFSRELESGYAYGLAEYRHDLDIRGAIAVLGLAAEIAESDVRVAAMLTATHIRVWESGGDEPWWDYGYPKNASPRLRRGLMAEGLLESDAD